MSEHLDISLAAAAEDDFAEFARRLQAAFAVALPADPHHDGALGPIPSDAELRASFDDPRSEVLHVMADGAKVGGMVLRVDPIGRRNSLDFFFIDPEHHSRGIGRRAWQAAERRHPETRVWETMTPHFETRNVHFYVNVCGFRTVEFFNPRHPDPHPPTVEDSAPEDDDDLMFRFEKTVPDPLPA